jgi:hypothetical protein
MSSKRKTPKKKSKEDDILFQAVHQMAKSKTPKNKTPKSKTPKNKTPKSKTPKNKTPKQKGGKDDDNGKDDKFLNEVKGFLVSKPNLDGIGIETTFMPLDGNKNNKKMFTEVKKNNDINYFYGQSLNNGGNKSFRVIQTFDEDDANNIDTLKGGYGKKYINNNVRLYEGLQKNNLIHLM